MPVVIMKDDLMLNKIRKALKNFKEYVMKDANIKFKIWKEKNQREVGMNGRNNFKN